MKFERDGSLITLSVPTGIGWNLVFSHRLHDELSAEAVRRHLQAHADQQDMYAKNREQHASWREQELHDQIRRLKRRVQHHRRQAARAAWQSAAAVAKRRAEVTPTNRT